MPEITIGTRILKFFGLAKIAEKGSKAAKAGSEVIRLGEYGEKIADGTQKMTKAAGEISKSLKVGAIGGLTTFFGFEWLRNGGLVSMVGGTLGINNTAASILVVVVSLGAVSIALYGIYRWVASRAPKARSRRR